MIGHELMEQNARLIAYLDAKERENADLRRQLEYATRQRNDTLTELAAEQKRLAAASIREARLVVTLEDAARFMHDAQKNYTVDWATVDRVDAALAAPAPVLMTDKERYRNYLERLSDAALAAPADALAQEVRDVLKRVSGLYLPESVEAAVDALLAKLGGKP